MENSKDNNTSQLTNKSTAEKNTKDKNKQKDSIIFPNFKVPIHSSKNFILHNIESNNIIMAENNLILNLPLYYEPIIEKEYLEDFYKDMKRYSFSFKVYLLNCRFRKYQQVIWNGGDGIQD